MSTAALIFILFLFSVIITASILFRRRRWGRQDPFMYERREEGPIIPLIGPVMRVLGHEHHR